MILKQILPIRPKVLKMYVLALIKNINPKCSFSAKLKLQPTFRITNETTVKEKDLKYENSSTEQ